MSDTKILQAILDGQVQIRKQLTETKESLEKKIDSVDKKVGTTNERIDKLGLQIARLEDDAPTRGEHDKLERRVTKIETKIASV